MPLHTPDTILVCGEALFDVFPTGSTPTGLALDARIGGSPFNVAMGLRRLGQPAAFFGAVSTDPAGTRLAQALTDETIDLRWLRRSPARTSLCMVALDAKGKPDYAFYGDDAADRDLPLDALAAVPTRIAAVQVGSYATVVEPVASTLDALVQRQQGLSVIAYDPNVRLTIEPDRAVWRSRLARWLPRTTLLKVSDEDLHLLFGDRPIADFAADALAAGVALVVVTRGSLGASAWVGDDRIDVAPAPVTLVDTVGAGDTFQAAMLARLAELDLLTVQAMTDGTRVRAAIDDVLAFATRAAAVTCSRRGADLPRRHEV
jgi:fructokinase